MHHPYAHSWTFSFSLGLSFCDHMDLPPIHQVCRCVRPFLACFIFPSICFTILMSWTSSASLLFYFIRCIYVDQRSHIVPTRPVIMIDNNSKLFDTWHNIIASTRCRLVSATNGVTGVMIRVMILPFNRFQNSEQQASVPPNTKSSIFWDSSLLDQLDKVEPRCLQFPFQSRF